MRFMLLLKGDAVGETPSVELIEAMIGYQEELTKAGVLLAAEGLLDSSFGARVVYSSSAGRRTVVDGPFTEAKELVAGFYLIQVKSREEAIEWAKRAPVHVAVDGHADRDEAVVEVRQIGDVDDLPEAGPEHVEAEQRLREARPAG
jgi:hypothetical protein